MPVMTAACYPKRKQTSWTTGASYRRKSAQQSRLKLPGERNALNKCLGRSIPIHMDWYAAGGSMSQATLEAVLGEPIDAQAWRKRMKQGVIVTITIKRWRARNKLS